MSYFHAEMSVCLLDVGSKLLASQSWEEMKRDGEGFIGYEVKGIIFNVVWHSREGITCGVTTADNY